MNRCLSVNAQALAETGSKAMLVDDAEGIVRHIHVDRRNVRDLCLTS